MRRDEIALPAGWAIARLRDIAELGPALDRCVVHDDIEVNFVPMRAVVAEGGGVVDPERRAYRDVKKGYTPFLSGDVISAKITPCMENGKTTVVPALPGEVCYGSTEFHVLRPAPGVRPDWIAHFLLQHDTRQAAQRSMTGGVGQMRVPGAFLEDLALPVAPSGEQQRIAEALDELFSDLDAAVAALQRVRGKLKLYRAAVLKAAVEGQLTAEWREQHPDAEPASQLLQRILDERRRRWEEDQLAKYAAKGKVPPKNWKAKYSAPSPLDQPEQGALPAGWSRASLSQLSWTSGYGTSVKCASQSAGLGVLRIPNILGGRLDIENLKFAPPAYEERKDDLVDVGDLLVVRTNGSRSLIGRGAVVHQSPTQSLSFASYLIRLRIVRLPSLLRWLSALWQSAHVRTWVERHAATSAGQFNISLGILEPLAIPLPPEAEQQAIVEAVEDQLSVIDHLEADLDAKLASAQALRQAILRDAFAGKLVPQDPNDEPASELLARIAAERQATAAARPARKKAQAGDARRGAKRLAAAAHDRGRLRTKT